MPLYALGDSRPSLEPGQCWVAPNAVLVGQVHLKKDASVWFGAMVRADNEPIIIGEGSNVQENSVLHVDPGLPLVIGNRCTIGHSVTLHGCEIGEGSLIGMGATILNGAKIGRHCIIGANALITEGKVIPDHSLVMGAPGKVMRMVSEEECLRIERNVSSYIARWRDYAQHLQLVEG